MKNVKLNKKTGKKPEKEPFYFFVKNQGEGAARVIVIILKILELIITSIFGLCLGIFAPLTILLDLDIADPTSQTAAILWLVTSAVYIIGTFVVMLGHSRIASGIHLLGAAGTLATYYNYMMMFAEVPDNNGPSVLYMPCLFLTVLTLVIMLLINLPKWLERRAAKEQAVAPSILAHDEKED